MTDLKVFISSTFEDLKEYRQAAIEVVNRFEGSPRAMEFFGALSRQPKKVCDDKIKDCDLFVGIYAHRYGFIPKGETKSITQLEYELAKKLNKDCLCFIIDQQQPWIRAHIEFAKQDELAAFLEKVKNTETCAFFTTVNHFTNQLLEALLKYFNSRWLPETEKDKTGSTGTTDRRGCAPIPKAPIPYFAHPYPLPENFTGRIAEQKLLSQWLSQDTRPVLVLDAIGGMGKTALTWVWLQHIIQDRGQDIAGVFWWSFYESPFEVFIGKLACYVLGLEDRGESRISVDLADLGAALHNGRFVLVLDGLERILAGYSGMNGAYTRDDGDKPGTDADTDWEKRQRVPVDHRASRFLTHLASPGGNTKTLVTSRLMPLPLEGLAGVNHVFLTGLNPEDAATFLHNEGVSGTRAELEQAAHVYGYHPLMLKLLASAVKRSRSKDIRAATRKGLINEKEPQKILTTMYKLLSKKERRVASTMAVNRSMFNFELAHALLPDMEEDSLWRVLMELRDLGFLFYEESRDCFDIHPLLRSFLYDRLTNPEEVHNIAVQYFQALPKKEKVVSLEDLNPIIELYRHLVKAGKFDEALKLFYDRITKATYYQLSAYQLQIELLTELFPPGPQGETGLPRLKDEAAQGWTLNELANTYALSGQPSKAVPLFLQCAKIPEKNNEKKNLAVGLGNVAYMAQMYIGRLSAGAAHLRKQIALCREIKDEAREAVGHQEWGRVLALQGWAKPQSDGLPSAADEFNSAFELARKLNHVQNQGLTIAYRSLAALLQGRMAALIPEQRKQATSFIKEALDQARQALEWAEKTAETEYPYPRDFVQAYWLLGEALLAAAQSQGCSEGKFHIPGRPRRAAPTSSRRGGSPCPPGNPTSGVFTLNTESFSIAFYDDYFQQAIETLTVAPGSELNAAERCLNEALRRCRKVNLVELEPDILISLARLEIAKISSLPPKETKIETVLASLEFHLRQALDIAQRAGYRLNLADIHLLAGQFLAEHVEHGGHHSLLGLDAVTHLEKTKEFSLDVSEFKDLYPSTNPDFYKDIPEAEMLKRGLTKEERIRNGYYVAYRCAELLLNREDTRRNAKVVV